MAETPDETQTSASSELDAVRAKLSATEQELNNYKLRLADFENARKRLLRDAEIERKYAIEPMARDLLAVLDNLDRALDAAKTADNTGPLAMGVAATVTLLLDILRRYGVSRIECPPGTVFDPNRHQAVMQQPTADFEPGQVVQTLQQGFLIHDRVLRPTSVIVAAAT
jgi:molecular chaperone GrpE